MKKFLVTSIIVAAVAATVGAYYLRHGEAGIAVHTAAVSQGEIVRIVGATGSLEAVRTVQVGSQVSGTIEALYADFNQVVSKGQLIARLDRSTLESQFAQAEAGLLRVRADLERVEVGVDEARTTLARVEALAAKRLVAEADLDVARSAVRTAEVQARSAAAQITQAKATVEQSRLNLARTDIVSPIDGIVIARSVDVGQTVAASLSAPTIFEIAEDLSRMQVKASVDEADVGLVKSGQTVRFTVDAYPEKTFTGHVMQVRLQPSSTQNVVSYTTVIDVPNPEFTLLPGMTANVTIEVARRDEATRIPNAALRFRPSAAVLEALGQAGDTGRAASGNAGVAVARAPTSAVPEVARAGAPGTGGTPGRIWTWSDGRLEAVAVRLGVADDSFTELIGGLPTSVTELVTGIDLGGSASAAAATTARSPLMQGIGGIGMPPPGGGPR